MPAGTHESGIELIPSTPVVLPLGTFIAGASPQCPPALLPAERASVRILPFAVVAELLPLGFVENSGRLFLLMILIMRRNWMAEPPSLPFLFGQGQEEMTWHRVRPRSF